MRALVLELVEGSTLADRIAQGPIRLDEALLIAGQIADALDAAHERGVIHRDLKPANIKITPDDKVKVLDFGLAKMLETATPSGALSVSPTLSAHATYAGVILGTAAYMSPEQARGKAVDKRTDVWAFGCVMYEMLTGQPPIQGEDVAEVIGAIIHKDIAWDRLPPNTPATVRVVLTRCLERDPKERIRDIGDVRLALRGAFGSEATVSLAAVSRVNWKLHVAWLVATIVTAAVGAVGVRLFWPHVESVRTVRFTVAAPPGTALNPDSYESLSPDGRRIALVVRMNGRDLIAIRDLEAEQAKILPGTDGARFPFWSPDSRFVGFFSQGKLKTIDQSGGPPQVLCDAPRGQGGTWNHEGTIVFAPDLNTGLFRVSAAGGTPTPVTKLDAAAKEATHKWPWFLPDGRHILFVTGPQMSVRIGSIDSLDHTQLLVADSKTIFADGYLLYVRAGALFAQPFNPERRTITGDPLRLAENMGTSTAAIVPGEFSASAGVLSYRTSIAGRGASQLAWFDRSGREISRLGERADQTGVELSPDGSRVAISILDTARATRDLWIYDTSKNSRRRLTFDQADDLNPIWSNDGTWIVFTSSRKGHFDLYQHLASGAGSDELLVADDSDKFPWTFSRDGRIVTYWRGGRGARGLGILQVEDRKASVAAAEGGAYAHLSPDGRWIAYEDAGGEVVAVPYPLSGGKWQISSAGGRRPRWRADGRELFYLSPDNRLMSVAVESRRPALIVEPPRPLFEARVRKTGYGAFGSYDYDVSPDGQRFLLNVVDDAAAEVLPAVVTNWTATLKK
jgi:Tol biopolymer transport system component